MKRQLSCFTPITKRYCSFVSFTYQRIRKRLGFSGLFFLPQLSGIEALIEAACEAPLFILLYEKEHRVSLCGLECKKCSGQTITWFFAFPSNARAGGRRAGTKLGSCDKLCVKNPSELTLPNPKYYPEKLMNFSVPFSTL